LIAIRFLNSNQSHFNKSGDWSVARGLM